MNSISTSESARERILKKASELFYRQGYHLTGINEIIEKSGVAKATFYAHFPSKEKLCLAYMHRMNVEDIEGLKQEIERKKTPFSRFMAVLEVIKPVMVKTDFKGCRFLNMASEVADPKSGIRKEGVQHFEVLRPMLRELSRDLIASDPDKYGHLNAEKLSDDYLTIQMGAIALCEIYHDTWPLDHAVGFVKRLLKK